jgi:uncharacterized short protein YbdD (DUF466 family)
MPILSPSAIRTRLQAIAATLRRVMGAPDYDRYLAHVRAHHPGQEPMSQEEFLRCRLEDRYNKPGSRCC